MFVLSAWGVRGCGGPEHPDYGFMTGTSARGPCSKVLHEAKENLLPRIPGQEAMPIDRESVQRMTFDELRQHICDTEPPPPSRRLSTLLDQGETIAERGGVRRQQLAKSLAGELDWIAMKAIEKDRKRRYQSARELAEDMGRYLDGEAVQACPPTLL